MYAWACFACILLTFITACFMLLLSLPKNIPFLHTTNGQNTDNFAPCLSVKFARHCKQMSALHFFPKSTEIVVTRVRSTKKLRMRG